MQNLNINVDIEGALSVANVKTKNSGGTTQWLPFSQGFIRLLGDAPQRRCVFVALQFAISDKTGEMLKLASNTGSVSNAIRLIRARQDSTLTKEQLVKIASDNKKLAIFGKGVDINNNVPNATNTYNMDALPKPIQLQYASSVVLVSEETCKVFYDMLNAINAINAGNANAKAVYDRYVSVLKTLASDSHDGFASAKTPQALYDNFHALYHSNYFVENESLFTQWLIKANPEEESADANDVNDVEKKNGSDVKTLPKTSQHKQQQSKA